MKRLSKVEIEEKQISNSIRRKSVLPSLERTSNIAPPIQAWRGSGLQMWNSNDDNLEQNTLKLKRSLIQKENSLHEIKTNENIENAEDLEYLRRNNKADCVLLTFGAYPNGNPVDNDIYAYPGCSKVIQSSNMLWSWLSRVAGAVVDKQAQESMEHILRLLNTLFGDDKELKSVKSLLCLTGLILYHNNQHIRSEKLITNSNVIDDTIHYFKFSCAAYGWKMLNPLMFADKRKAVLLHGFVNGDIMNNKALCEHTGIHEDDIIATKWTSSDYHPAHYIALDHSTNSIVIAIRGSFHVKDALVDLIAAASPFQGGYAHTGMLECAKRKFSSVHLPILHTIGKFPNYKLVVIGHSLGAGTAALLTLLLKDAIPCSTPIQCFAYAPPCVLSPQLAKSSESLIKSFILGNDCVPRLSFASVKRLRDLCCLLMNEGNSGVSILLKAKRKQIDIDALNNSIPFDLDTALLPPGECYHIIPESEIDDSSPSLTIDDPEIKKKCFRMEKSCPTLFSDLIVSSDMFSDHVPWNYQTAFQGLQLYHNLLQKEMNSPQVD